MKIINFLVAIVFFATSAIAQRPSVTWGEEFKLKKGSTDLEVIYTDATGVYIKESHIALKSYFLIGASYRESATLIKLDKNLSEVYSTSFNKELKGKEYEKFIFLKNKLFLFASDYDKKSKTLSLFATELDKTTGDQSGDWEEVASWTKDDKKESINFVINYNTDSSSVLIASTVEGAEKNSYEIRQVNEKLKTIGKPVIITNEFEKNLFDVESIFSSPTGNFAIVGRTFEYQEGKKKKAKYLDFKNYNIRLYDPAGKMIKEINTEINGKWLTSATVRNLTKTDIVLAAFYSNDKKAREINGMLVQRINAKDGSIISTNDKAISTAMLEDRSEDGDESKDDKKERERLEKLKDEQEGFSKHMRFRQFIVTSDGGIVLLAESYNSYTYSTTTTTNTGTGVGFGTRQNTTTYQVFVSGEMLMSKVDNKGNISWLKMLPKMQTEQIVLGRSSGPATGVSFSSYFNPGANLPFYSGFGVNAVGDNIQILFNDHKKNESVLDMGQRAKSTGRFGNSYCYMLKLDALTGKFKREVVLDNGDNPTLMPRLGSVHNGTFYAIGKDDKVLAKTKIAVAKIVLK